MPDRQPSKTFQRILTFGALLGIAALTVLALNALHWIAPRALEGAPAIAATTAALVLVALGILWVAHRKCVRPLLDREEALRSANRAHQALIEASPIAIFDLDRTGAVGETWNAAAERLFGWSHAEVRSKHLPYVPADREGEFMEAVNRIFAGETLIGLERTRMRKDGSLLGVSISAAPVATGTGVPERIICVVTDLTTHRRQEARIDYQARLLGCVSDAVTATDTSLRITAWNEAAETLYGWKSDEVLGRNIVEVLDASFLPDPVERAITRMGQGSVYQDEVTHRTMHGRRVPVETRVSAIVGADGTVAGFVASHRDISSRRAAEHALAESEDRFHRLMENLPDVVYRLRLSPEPGLDYISPAIHGICGYSPAECYTNPAVVSRVIHPDDQPLFASIMAHPEKLAARSIRMRLNHRDGRTRWTDHRYQMVRDCSGRITAIEGVARDITDIRAAEEERVRLAAVIEQSSDAVIATELDGRIIYVNSAFSRITGWSREEALGKNPRLLNSGKQDSAFYRTLWDRLLAGETWHGQVRNRRKDGELYDADILISPVRDGSGVVRHYVGIQRDITDMLAREDQLRQAQKMEAVGQLTGGFAHDFNNLLTVILANAGLLESLPLAPEAQDNLRDITAAAGQGAQLIRRLLAFSRREGLKLVSMDPVAMTEELLSTLRRLLPENIAIDFDCEQPCDSILADRGALSQVLLNLATNSRDAMPDGGRLRIWIGPGENGPQRRTVSMEVSDTGSGMSPEVKRRVFEPFFTTKPTGQGTGLGLAMVYGLMRQHNGSVRLDSAPGAGTRVTLTFPSAVAAGPSAGLATGRESMPTGSERILLVEDQPVVRRVTRGMLESLGYAVTEACDGRHALEALRGPEPAIDLIVTDVVMPEMGGLELERELRNRGIAVPLLFTTGYSGSSHPTGGLAASALVLEKPWTMKELATKVREALSLEETSRAA